MEFKLNFRLGLYKMLTNSFAKDKVLQIKND